MADSKAGMRFGKMNSLIQEINGMKTKISNKLNSIINTYPSRVAACYSGDAAEAFKGTLSKEANSIEQLMNEMIEQLKNNADEQQTAYKNKVAALESTVKSGGGN